MKSLVEIEIKRIKETTPIKIGAKVRELRNKQGITQTKLAELVLKDRQYIYKIEKGAVTPNVSTINILANALQTPLKDFFDFEN